MSNTRTTSQPETLVQLVDISQPHDRLIKVLLLQPETAEQFFRERLPVEIAEQLASDLPEFVEGSFVPDALSLFISDKLFLSEDGPRSSRVYTCIDRTQELS